MTDQNQPASKELARRTGTYGGASLSERQQYALALSRAADLLPKNYWDNPKPDGNGGMIPAQPNPGKVLFMTETAAMLGIHPMAGLTNIHIIEGKPTLSAGLWAALVREAGHRLRVWVEGEGDGLRAVAELTRSDDPDFAFRVAWSVEDARRAGLLNKDNWKKYLRSMLKSRAIVEVIREGAPEVGMGAAYTPEELDPNLAVNEQGDPVDLQQVPSSPAPSQTGTPQPPVMKPEPEAKPETAAPEEEFDYVTALKAAETADDCRALHARARSEGALDREVKFGRKKFKLGALIVEVGTEKANAEREATEVETGADVDTGEIVDAEIVDDGPSMALGGDQ